MADVKPESPAPRGEKLEAQIKSADMVLSTSLPSGFREQDQVLMRLDGGYAV